jgi:hypothetical protein
LEQVIPELAAPHVDKNRDRFGNLDSNPVKQVVEEPVSTFSIDTDTSSYSFLRRSLMENLLPPKDAVRVEEMINYFPYDYEAPADRSQPFKANVTLMQTPWNPDTQLMHIAGQAELFDKRGGVLAEVGRQGLAGAAGQQAFTEEHDNRDTSDYNGNADQHEFKIAEARPAGIL